MSADSYPRYFVTNIIKLLHRQQLLSCTVTNCRDAPRCTAVSNKLLNFCIT